MNNLMSLYIDLYDASTQKLNADGEIIGYVLPESYSAELNSLVEAISRVKNENNEARNFFTSAPIYTKKQWELYEFLTNMTVNHILDEEWVTDNVSNNHFKYHCLGGGNYTSKDDEIFYDFTTKEEFDKYEEEVSKKALNPDITIDNLTEPDFLANLILNLSNGKTILLSETCGLKGKSGPVKYAFVPFANEATTNYNNSSPIINFMVLTPDDKTISLYPILLSYFPQRIGRMTNRNKTDTPINTQRLTAFKEISEKLKDIHFEDIVRDYMRDSQYNGENTLLFPNKFFSVYSHAYPYTPKGKEEPVTSVVFIIRSRDIRDVRTKYYYSYNEEQFRKNVEDALATIKTQMEEQNRIDIEK